MNQPTIDLAWVLKPADQAILHQPSHLVSKNSVYLRVYTSIVDELGDVIFHGNQGVVQRVVDATFGVAVVGGCVEQLETIQVV